MYFGLGVGSTYSGTAGSWSAGNFLSATGATSVVGTNGATFYITGVQLEKGSTATSFDYRPYGTELALCQRYYYKRVGSQTVYYEGAGVPSAYINWVATHPVTMRASPTQTIIGTYVYSNASGVGFSAANVDLVTIQAPTSGATGRTYFYSDSTSGYSASAEL